MRECGACTLCCTTSAVPELGKPFGEKCGHCAVGCGIYAIRPRSCRSFECAWLKGELPEDMRPDLSGVVVEHLPNTPRTVLALTLGRDDEIPLPIVRFYNDSGRAVLARGRRAFLPEGLNYGDAMSDMHAASLVMGIGR